MLRQLLKITLALALLNSSDLAAASQAPLRGNLGHWLTQKAAPELADVLANHPKFKGQRVTFAAIESGKPATASNGLVDRIIGELSHVILRKGNNDIVGAHRRVTCHTFKNQAAFLVGIDITRTSTTRHSVNIVILDTQESVWVSGVSLKWSGRLLRSETAALAKSIQTSPKGTSINPIHINQHQQLAELVYTQLRCNLPNGLEGSIYITHAGNTPNTGGPVAPVVADLQQKFAVAPALITTNLPAQAQWQLELALTNTNLGSHQLHASLTPLHPPGTPQKIATVFVSGVVPDQPRQDPSLTSTFNPPAPQLLSALRMQAQAQGCKGNSDCADISFELNKAAHVLVFQTQHGAVQPLDCATRAQTKRTPGKQRYRVHLPNDRLHSRVGFYVLATQDTATAKKLQQQINSAPGPCSKNDRQNHQRWLHATLAVLDSQSDFLVWRAIHIRNTPQGLLAI
jgi:hypothetical protein